MAQIDGCEGVGIEVEYNKLFRRYTRNAKRRRVVECLFADDGAIASSTRAGAEKAMAEISTKFRLTVSIPKIKHMAAGREANACDKVPITAEGGDIEAVEYFPYLGSIVSASGTIDADVEARIAKASRAFGALRRPVFIDRNLTLETKRQIYSACVLMYGSECWTPLRRHVRKLNTFHHRAIRIILGITNREQWSKHITMTEIRRRWGDHETASENIVKRRLQWLVHLARMQAHTSPKPPYLGGCAILALSQGMSYGGTWKCQHK